MVRGHLHADLVEPGGSDFGDYLADFEDRDDGGEILLRVPFRHRLTMAGEPIDYVAVVAQQASVRVVDLIVEGGSSSNAQAG